MEWSATVQMLITALLLGGLMVLNNISLSLIYGIIKLVNLAHGEIVILGGYLALILNVFFGFDPIISFPFVFLVLFVFGYLLYYSLIRRIVFADIRVTLSFFYGISLIIINTLQHFLGTFYRSVSSPLQQASLYIGSIAIPCHRLTAALLGFTIMAMLTYFIKNTFFGIAIRVVSENVKIAPLMGVNPHMIFAIVTAISFGINGIAGALISVIAPINPTLGAMWATYAWFAAIVGGMGYLPGTVIASLLLGFIYTLVSAWLGPRYILIILYIAMFIALVIFPRGILKRGM